MRYGSPDAADPAVTRRVVTQHILAEHCLLSYYWYNVHMSKVEEQLDVAPVALTDDLTAMADYARSPEGRAAIERGLADIREGRAIEGKGALSAELKRRAEARRG
jgi:hypothetical protein